MGALRTALILLLIVSLPVSAIGVVDERMPCEREFSPLISDAASATDPGHGSMHAHHTPPGDGPAVVDGPIADHPSAAYPAGDNLATDAELLAHVAGCPCSTDCDMTHCAGVNHATAVIDLGHLLPANATSAAPAHGQQLRLSAPPITLLRPPITV